jgi:hypothetical protein
VTDGVEADARGEQRRVIAEQHLGSWTFVLVTIFGGRNCRRIISATNLVMEPNLAEKLEAPEDVPTKGRSRGCVTWRVEGE